MNPGGCRDSRLTKNSCSIILFLLRAIVQLIFFTPKASPFDPTRNHPYIGAIFASNLFCMASHKLVAQPDVGEELRGYMHGGLFIDFIGQKGPVSVVRLLVMDFLVLMIDFIMLGLVIERVKMVEISKGVDSQTTTTTNTSGDETQQDHDSEERGVLRGTRTRTGEDGIELDDLGTNTTSTSTTSSTSTSTRHNNTTADDDDNDPDNERTNLLADPDSDSRLNSQPNNDNHQTMTARPTHPLDAFVTGEILLVDIGLLGMIRDQWRYSPASAASRASTTSTSASGSSAPAARSRYVPSAETTAFLRERFGLQINADGRVERIDR